MADFQKVKAEHSVESVAERLGLPLKKDGIGFRCPCPSGQGDERALAITPGKGWYSFATKKGGDVISLVEFVRKCSAKEAGVWIAGHEPEKSTNGRAPNAEFKPVELLHDHPSVMVSGLEADDAKRFGIGYKDKAAGAGNILVPVYANGKLAGYVGCLEITWLPPNWRA